MFSLGTFEQVSIEIRGLLAHVDHRFPPQEVGPDSLQLPATHAGRLELIWVRSNCDRRETFDPAAVDVAAEELANWLAAHDRE
jgi:hypothetical protein